MEEDSVDSFIQRRNHDMIQPPMFLIAPANPHNVPQNIARNSEVANVDDVSVTMMTEVVPPRAAYAQQEPQACDFTHNWQSSKTTVRERLSCLLLKTHMSDVVFNVGREEPRDRFPAHKFVLSIGSAVFDAMFNGPMAVDGEIAVPDVEPDAFRALLKFLYTDEVDIGPDSVMTTLYAAKKYAVPAMEHDCVDFLKRNLSSENAFMLLTQARFFDEPQLAAMCLERIDKNTTEAFNSDCFLDIDLDTLSVVLERDTLGIREIKLYHAVIRWAEAEAKRRSLCVSPASLSQVLGRALYKIRFPLMSIDEFASDPAQSGILTDRQAVALFLHFTLAANAAAVSSSPANGASQSSCAEPPPVNKLQCRPVLEFSDVPRCCLTGKEQVVLRFCQIESRWGYSGTSDRIRFMVNRKIFVVGYGLYGSIHGPADYQVKIELIHADTGRIMGQNDCQYQCDGTQSTFRVTFKEPVEVTPNVNYVASSTLKGVDSYYGTKGLRKVTHESASCGKVVFNFTYAAGNNNGTSVEDGQIPEIIFYT